VNLWTDPRLQSLDPTTKLVAAYSISNTHSVSEGLYRLPLDYVRADLRLTKGQIGKAFAALEPWHLIYDAATEVVFVVDGLKVSAPSTQKQLEGAIRLLKTLPPTALLRLFYSAAEKHATNDISIKDKDGGWERKTTFTEALREAFPSLSHPNETPVSSESRPNARVRDRQNESECELGSPELGSPLEATLGGGKVEGLDDTPTHTRVLELRKKVAEAESQADYQTAARLNAEANELEIRAGVAS
jgi:hypothetical protein